MVTESSYAWPVCSTVLTFSSSVPLLASHSAAAMEVDVPVLGKRSMDAHDEENDDGEGRGRKKPRSG